MKNLTQNKIAKTIKHRKENCNANNIFIITGGLQCANCLAVNFEAEMSQKQFNKYVSEVLT